CELVPRHKERKTLRVAKKAVDVSRPPLQMNAGMRVHNLAPGLRRTHPSTPLPSICLPPALFVLVPRHTRADRGSFAKIAVRLKIFNDCLSHYCSVWPGGFSPDSSGA